jgi:sulfite reductase (NADPH) flavoprotein alpha-component
MSKIAYIPQDAPFNEDQRAWISGFLAGLHSRLAMNVNAPPPPVADQVEPGPSLRILYGTQTGNAEGVANDAAAAAKTQGFDVTVSGLDEIELDEFAGLKYVLIVTSTYGEGEMPDNAELFWEALSADTAPRLEGVSFGVLALGDTGYDGFCQAGKLFDMRLEQLGAARVLQRVDCDVDYESDAASWVQSALTALVPTSGATGLPSMPAPSAVARSGWTRKNPFVAEVSTNRVLSGPGSDKEIRHVEFALADSGIEYEAGDALAVIPENNPSLVDAIAEHFRVSIGTLVGDATLGELLSQKYEISAPSKDLLGEVESRADNEELSHVLRGGVKETLDRWLYGKDVLDILRIAGDDLSVEEFIGLLKPLQHRAYSISSSPLAHPSSIHLTVAAVRYVSNGRDRGGVCSTFLADRAGTSKIFLQPNKSFRVPVDDDVPMVMVGPGTGVAPFRAFLQERALRGAKGRNWLFFGDQHQEHDFAYADEITAWQESGVLTRLELAFSRDQPEKIYVQNRMLEHGRELFSWLEEGGHFYVCGDATRMAKDVDRALHVVVAEHGGLDADGATEYVNALKKDKRYVRDVY